jgi:hypothetical protein
MRVHSCELGSWLREHLLPLLQDYGIFMLPLPFNWYGLVVSSRMVTLKTVNVSLVSSVHERSLLRIEILL